ncbi:MAG: Lrp/AsnC family transcriptional regulator, partial [Acidimicrobiales bacterium]
MRIDDLDRTIIASLVEDGRASLAAIGEQVGLSASAVKRRVDRLLDAGVIRRFSAVVDPAAAGQTVTEAFVELTCPDRTSPAEIRAIARRHPEVVAAYTVTGTADALFHVRAGGLPDLERVLERIRT